MHPFGWLTQGDARYTRVPWAVLLSTFGAGRASRKISEHALYGVLGFVGEELAGELAVGGFPFSDVAWREIQKRRTTDAFPQVYAVGVFEAADVFPFEEDIDLGGMRIKEGRPWQEMDGILERRKL